VAAPLPASALAAKGGGAMSLSRTQAVAARGDQQAAAVLSTNTSRAGCMSGCASRGYRKRQCVSACRPGICHPGQVAVLRNKAGVTQQFSEIFPLSRAQREHSVVS
jgi:hypothetical protein